MTTNARNQHSKISVYNDPLSKLKKATKEILLIITVEVK